LVLLAAALVIVLFFAMKEAPGETEPVELRVYTVPRELHNDIHSSLRHALAGMSGDNSKLVGRVASGPNGTLVVTAPPDIHDGIADFLAELDAMERPASPPAPVSMTYWFIVGRPVDQAALAQTPEQYLTTGKRRLDNLDKVLREISSVQGPTEFRLMDQIRITSIGHDRTEARGKYAIVEQRTTRADGGNVVGEVLLTFEGGNMMRSQVMLEPDQLLVLGQAGINVRRLAPFGPREDTEDATLYYVMTSSLER
jgi:hypothetical protein